MSSSQVYPSLTGTMDPGHMGTDTTTGLVSTDWYSSGSYAYTHDPGHNPYHTPYPSSTVEAQPWTPYAQSSNPDPHLNQYGMHPPRHTQRSPPATTQDPGRPRSSPSTLQPSAETIQWSGGLGIQYTTSGGHPTPPVTSTFPPVVFTNYPLDDTYSPPELRQAKQPRRSYPSIAPNPAGLPAAATGGSKKRNRGDDDHSDPNAPGRMDKRKRTASVASADLSEEDRFLVQLKEEENLPWKDIATRFLTDKKRTFQVAALQMRYKRLREKFRNWEEQDLQALKLAHEYWEKYKWEIISAKMLDFGINERWPARHCTRKWQELEPTAVVMNPTPSTMSQYSSPIQTNAVTTAAQFPFISNYPHHP